MKTLIYLALAAMLTRPSLTFADATSDTPFPISRENLRVRDPFVVTDQAHHRYLLVSTIYAKPGEKSDPWGNAGTGVQIYISPDLKHFSEPRQVLKLDPKLNCTAVWAPEMHLWRGKWYLFATLTFAPGAWPISSMPNGRGRLGKLQPRGTWIFSSDSPLGPFSPIADHSATPRDWMCLDGTFFVADNRPYMIFCHEWCQTGDGRMMLSELSPDLQTTVGKPKELFTASSVGTPHYITDGPYLHRSAKSGKLFMLWSNGSATGYAVYVKESTSGRIEGPWKNSQMLFSSNGGHAMIFKTLDGSLALTLHRPNLRPKERPAFFTIEDLGDALRIGAEIGATAP